jgi:hypothetical protein
MPFNLVQASHATGRSKSTVLRAIRRGVLSANRDEATGGWLIEPAELHRVYPPVAPGSFATADDADRNHNGTNATAELRELRVRLEASNDAIRVRDDVIADLRRRLDAEAEERRRLTAVLADRSTAPAAPIAPQPAPPAPQRSWLSWRRRG